MASDNIMVATPRYPRRVIGGLLSIEEIREFHRDDVLALERFLPVIRREGVRLLGLVVPVLETAVDVLGDEVLAGRRRLPERLARPGAASTVVLEPLAARCGREPVREGVVRDGC